jgi:DNA helicase HerA-like ATPase
VYERFQNLRAIGIYSSTPPPFDPRQPIWQYQLKPLEIPVQAMLVDLVAARVFERSMHRGIQSDVVELLVIDEGRRFLGDSNEEVLSRIANEARKFGLGLWVLSQTPEHLPDDFLKSTGTIVVLGLAKADAGVAARKLGVDESLLASIVPQRTAAVQIKLKGSLSSDFQLIAVN